MGTNDLLSAQVWQGKTVFEAMNSSCRWRRGGLERFRACSSCSWRKQGQIGSRSAAVACKLQRQVDCVNVRSFIHCQFIVTTWNQRSPRKYWGHKRFCQRPHGEFHARNVWNTSRDLGYTGEHSRPSVFLTLRILLFGIKQLSRDCLKHGCVSFGAVGANRWDKTLDSRVWPAGWRGKFFSAGLSLVIPEDFPWPFVSESVSPEREHWEKLRCWSVCPTSVKLTELIQGPSLQVKSVKLLSKVAAKSLHDPKLNILPAWGLCCSFESSCFVLSRSKWLPK